MSPSRSHCILFLALALTGCASPAQNVGQLLWPDQLHLTYETGDGGVEGRNGGRGLDTERDALLFGLSWDISARNQGVSREDLRWLILELRQEAAPVTAAAPEVNTTEAAAPVEVIAEEPPPEPAPVEVVAEEPPPEPVPEELAPVEVVAEVVPEVIPEPEPEPVPVEAPPPPVEEPVVAAVIPVVEEPVVEEVVLEPVAPAPIEEPEGRTLYGVVLVSALGVLGVALALRFLPGLRTARVGRG